MNEKQLRELGQRIVEARKLKGWNQTALARESGMTDTTVRKIERGESVSPGYLRKVLDALGMDPVESDREVYPPDVELVRDLVALYLMAVAPEERAKVAHDLTRFLMDRQKSTPTDR